MPETVETLIERHAAAARAAADRFGGRLLTPVIASISIGPETGATLLFKAENFQRTGSFKIRGAMNRMLGLSPDEGRRGLITASSGNHGIACASAARECGFPVTIVLPENAAPAKRKKIAALGAEIVIHGAESGAAERHARALSEHSGKIYISPYNDPDVIAGQGTIALELLRQVERIDHVFVAMGGGGLIGGIGAVFKALSPKTRIIGCSAAASPALEVALRSGQIAPVEHRETLADGVAGDMEAGSVTFPLCRAVIDEIVALSEDEIENAFRRIALEEKQIVEGSAALALAGFLKLAERCRGQTAVIVMCGANIGAEKALSLLCQANTKDI